MPFWPVNRAHKGGGKMTVRTSFVVCIGLLAAGTLSTLCTGCGRPASRPVPPPPDPSQVADLSVYVRVEENASVRAAYDPSMGGWHVWVNSDENAAVHVMVTASVTARHMDSICLDWGEGDGWVPLDSPEDPSKVYEYTSPPHEYASFGEYKVAVQAINAYNGYPCTTFTLIQIIPAE